MKCCGRSRMNAGLIAASVFIASFLQLTTGQQVLPFTQVLFAMPHADSSLVPEKCER